MGAPSKQSPRTAQDVLRDIVRGSEHSVAESDLRATGVDVDMLEATFEIDVLSHIDYLHGYKPLDDLDPLGEFDRPGDWDFQKQPTRYVQAKTWHDVLGRFRQLGKHRQTLPVFDAALYCHDREWTGPQHIRIRISLTREGTWVFWYAETGRDGKKLVKPRTERLSVHKTVRELWQEVHRLVPDGFKIAWRGAYRLPATVPLSIEHGLRRILQHTNEQRERRLEDMKRSHENASQRVGIIAYER